MWSGKWGNTSTFYLVLICVFLFLCQEWEQRKKDEKKKAKVREEKKIRAREEQRGERKRISMLKVAQWQERKQQLYSASGRQELPPPTTLKRFVASILFRFLSPFLLLRFSFFCKIVHRPSTMAHGRLSQRTAPRSIAPPAPSFPPSPRFTPRRPTTAASSRSSEKLSSSSSSSSSGHHG